MACFIYILVHSDLSLEATELVSEPESNKGTSMYYVSKKGGGRGSAKCLLLLTWGEGGLRGHAYVIIVWKKNAE